MGKPFMSSQLELVRNRQRDSLDIFGQTSLLQQHSRGPGSQTNVPLFSKTPGSAWDEALKAAERLLEGKDISTGRPSNASRADARLAKASISGKPSRASEGRVEEVSLDNLIVQLEAAEKDPNRAASDWAGVVQDSPHLEDHTAPQQHEQAQQQAQQQQQQQQAQQEQHLSYQQKYQHQQHYRRPESSDSRRSRKSSESEATVWSGVSEDYLSERADQWGYGVVLKGSSRDSTPRTSGGSMTGSRTSGGSQAVPAVSRDVKDALSSFMLAFLVCDCTQTDLPILYASAGFTTMTGYTTEEIVGKNCRFLQGPDTDREEIAKVREALKNGALYTGTLLNYKKDGTPFWNLLTLSPIKDDDGKLIKYIGMQAEQHSKEAQPRNSRGQKSPAIRSVAKDKAPSRATQNGDRDKHTPDRAAAGTSHRSHSSSSIPRPPIVPNKTSPAPGAQERRISGPELYPGEDQSKRMSHRYSLTSNPVRSSRNSSVEEFQSPHNRRVSKLQEIILDKGFKGSSSSETPDTPTRADSPRSFASSDRSKVSPSSEKSKRESKSKSNRLTARILRLFRKDSKESKRKLEAIARGKEVMEVSGSDDDETEYSARSSGTSRRHSSVGGYSATSGRSSSQMRLEASADDLTAKLARMQANAGGQQTMMSSSSSIPRPPFDGSKQQFCIVESSTPPSRPAVASSFNGGKQQFCIVESSSPSPSPRASGAFDGSKRQFCIVEPSSPQPPPPAPAFDGSNKQQFCIVHT